MIISNLRLHLCFLLLFSDTFLVQADDQEHIILLRMKEFWNNPPVLDHWNTQNVSHCSWPEIKCSRGSITGILLINTNISGTIPPFISHLINLTILDVNLNYMNGNFPTVLYNCSNLVYLDLSQNYFTGRIPADINRMSRLRFLNLGANNFTGDIPSTIGRLPELQELDLYQNQFGGTFPAEIGNLPNLQVLKMAYNGFKPSPIPQMFTKLRNLKYLWMSSSNLIGEIPGDIGKMEALEHIDLSQNNLSGKIPQGLFKLQYLRELYLYDNNLSGEIPSQIEAPSMAEIDLGQNNLSGMIPESVGKLRKLEVLSLFSNQISGKIPESIGQLPALRSVKLFSNDLTGQIPVDLGRFSTLKDFEVSGNRLTGELPEHLCYNGVLIGVVAFNNNLSGKLPRSLEKCSSLTIIIVDGNKLSGEVPAGLWSLANLATLVLSENLFTGILPNKFPPSLSRLEISNNMFSGAIPSAIASAVKLVIMKANRNNFTGSIPEELTALPALSTLSLSSNQFSGQLPENFISWTSLTALDLRSNQLIGSIPSAIGSLPNLIDLDLSKNDLSGRIPASLANLNLVSLNLSSNNLSGEIPAELEKSFISAFLLNPRLCSMNHCSDSNLKHRKNSSLLFIIMCIVATSFLVSSCLLVIFVIRRIPQVRDPIYNLTSFQKLSFNDSNILTNLTEDNLIGEGGSGRVYRVAVDNSGNYVAVKKITDIPLETEIEILGRIKHLNIVKLLCYLSTEESNLLVYEYMKNGSLDQYHRRRTSSVRRGLLDWPKRMRIVVGAAQGLCYMHHHHSPPIVHRDVKSSNILIDSEFNAKIADFGLAKMAIGRRCADTASKFVGSIGYIAPECAQNARVNEKIDVYGFGVILLELVTGREADEGDGDSSLVEWAQKQLHEGNPKLEALDDEVKEACYIDQMRIIFKLGVLCTRTSPSSRPSINDVLQVLLRYSQQMVFRDKSRVEVEYEGAPLLRIPQA